jgi:hypothetical protein
MILYVAIARLFLICFGYYVKKKIISISIYEREKELTRNIWVSHSGCWTKFQEKIQYLMLIVKSSCWVFLIEVFEVGSCTSLVVTEQMHCLLWSFYTHFTLQYKLSSEYKCTIKFFKWIQFTFRGKTLKSWRDL